MKMNLTQNNKENMADESPRQITYTVTVEKDGKEVEITSRYTPTGDRGVWEAYNPFNGWNDHDDWVSGWSEWDEEENTLRFYATLIDNEEQGFKNTYKEWVEEADPRDIGKTNEFEVTLKELLYIDSEPLDYPDGSVNVTVTIDDVTFIEKEEEE